MAPGDDDLAVHSSVRWLVSGRDPWWLPAVAYFLVLLVVFVGGVVLGTAGNGEPTLPAAVFDPILFPGLLLYAPPAVAVLIAVRRFPPLASVALGLSAGLGFAALGVLAALLGTSGNGDSPLWALSLAYAGIGLVTAVAGHAAGLALRLGTDRFA